MKLQIAIAKEKKGKVKLFKSGAKCAWCIPISQSAERMARTRAKKKLHIASRDSQQGLLSRICFHVHICWHLIFSMVAKLTKNTWRKSMFAYLSIPRILN